MNKKQFSKWAVTLRTKTDTEPKNPRDKAQGVIKPLPVMRSVQELPSKGGFWTEVYSFCG